MQSTCPDVADFSKISHFPEGANKEFQDKDKDQLLEFFLPKFEVDRPLAHHLDGLFEVFNLNPETVSVEVGPGTGLLTREFSKRPGKKVYATELSEGFIQHLRDDDRIEKDKVEIIHSTEDDLCLPTESDGSVDLAVLCDVYHHLTHPRTIVQQLKRSLKDTGRLVLVDFWRDPSKSSREDKTWVIEHLRADKDVFVEEIRSVGFEVASEPEVEGLVENYVVIFKKA
ncbi:2-heptaprenyl-1,4-naphthoquinone methyltransferase, putative [Perkinsus marinus ATCC 50983]|uniref:2-heptaprenyl-1,4-naphthoquinone methyltransferase, putative n=1 Tax=Perkinsus marinus (strain ATCC 50983 / TXsc) TaxID=423536 RepID=C5KJW0_PERM5|nr:2-heptaprenyl-1,4-naphthoquinone methyltransferase, putative [Perkinsus marinus ATCC 50983]EER15218.1 2-heptaprenyl-1,4-naphthoquinone methyltransferase, putative [Perkinsus marinus ATCC 50983]|eukprot:XP_002783422.1 2-heptaprenyl-1,4-naphthoquinone methyltransferase, putative [Perkinsus marinus ATCC 50983]